MALAAITILIWVLAYAGLTARTLIDSMGSTDPLGFALRRAVTFSVAAAVTFLLYPPLKLTERWSLAGRFGAALLLAMLGGAAYTTANELVFYRLLPVGESPGGAREIGLRYLLNVSWVSWTFLACLGAYLGMSYNDQVRERELQLVRARALAVDTQNQMLRQQINPHFLFNTLNALSTLVLQEKNATAERMILLLARFMRRSLQADSASLVTLAEEIEAEAEYLSIEQIRFGDRMRMVWAISEEASPALVPSLILQPIVENAVKHGVASTGKTVTITVCAVVEDQRLRISVTDDGGSDSGTVPSSGLGVGLENVRLRLKTLYGSAAAFRSGARQPHGFGVELELPLSKAAAAV